MVLNLPLPLKLKINIYYSMHWIYKLSYRNGIIRRWDRVIQETQKSGGFGRAYVM